MIIANELALSSITRKDPSMATSTNELFDFEGALKQWTDATRKATEEALDLYVKTVDEFATAGVRAAKATKVPALATIAQSHADVSREVAGTYAGSVRDLVKA
jgi:hypothetical protein